MREGTSLKVGIMYSLFEWFNPVYAIDKASGYRTAFFPATKTLPELKDLVRLRQCLLYHRTSFRITV
jgi:hypothetical protein